EEKESQKEKMEKKPSVLKKLKENQQKIKQEEKNKDIKALKKDKGMEL
ncbi:TPA: conjugal transfer protein, partial [Streptococcus equi subsp. equi]|nr:conjugal transfer protein [Streptococcus equi subsp. equi]